MNSATPAQALLEKSSKQVMMQEPELGLGEEGGAVAIIFEAINGGSVVPAIKGVGWVGLKIKSNMGAIIGLI